MSLLDKNGEVRVQLADGWTLRSGVYEGGELTSGEYVRLCDPNGAEYLYWDQEEWRADPALVMGAIINASAGLRNDKDRVECGECPLADESACVGYHYEH